jgi:hypothetical protein
MSFTHYLGLVWKGSELLLHYFWYCSLKPFFSILKSEQWKLVFLAPLTLTPRILKHKARTGRRSTKDALSM